ncbi:hypothetical protein [Hydrogenophaga sp.]|uniref:hypothetical protein n=1 Tax=Hydrogenophaga sp. TaxID=1904254 RepID=UPI003561BD6E
MTNNSSWNAPSTRRALIWMGVFVLMGLTGCGDGQGAKASAPAEPTAEQKVAQLEASGVLPKLDRLPTLEGVDANGDGVRDDIALHIEKKYADLAQRKAAMQMARAYQSMVLVNRNDAVALDAVSGAGVRAVNCISIIYPSLEEFKVGHQMSSELEALTTNTKERLRSYLAYNKARSGTVSRMPEGDTCD